MGRTWAGVALIGVGLIMPVQHETCVTLFGVKAGCVTEAYTPGIAAAVGLIGTGVLLATVWSDVPANTIEFGIAPSRVQIGEDVRLLIGSGRGQRPAAALQPPGAEVTRNASHHQPHRCGRATPSATATRRPWARTANRRGHAQASAGPASDATTSVIAKGPPAARSRARECLGEHPNPAISGRLKTGHFR